MGFDSHGRSNYDMHSGSFRAQCVKHVHAKEYRVTSELPNLLKPVPTFCEVDHPSATSTVVKKLARSNR